MALPPLLEKHIESLRKEREFEIEVKEGQEICIVIKNYPIPTKYWDKDKTNLLIIAHPTYPNAKMDMFWIDPPIALKSGQSPKAVGNETKCDKIWQRFSWHVNSWNPGIDNLITYLNTIDDRLNRDE